MGALEKIAFYQGRRDEVPNRELARELAKAKDREGLREIADNLWNKERNVASDCIKVLYEIGYIDPSLIEDYTADFLKLLGSRNNRLVWGAMLGLSTVADRRADEIWGHIDAVIRLVEGGTVITKVTGVRVLAGVAAHDAEYSKRILPVLLALLRTCIPRDVRTHAESMLPAVNEGNRMEVLAVLESRMGEMTPSQKTRLLKVIRTMQEG
jgi:hypothetical protein